MDENKKAAPQREAALKNILARMPGNDSAMQRVRMLMAQQELGSVTTFEAMRYLDVFDPRPRIHELRKAGYAITTVMRAEETESGVQHKVGVYFLSQATEVGTC
ncbi:helix-turn-helix domain-containing protein [Paraburkholderia sp. MPAMCS5]|uniref:helix-turn-helix domain-containing protein n=1 Tax=Paraburkholderia sp. MPAMCS5 TaxID=3112563 RepID=UPI002E198DAA|nr:helix-turn-helix domain-containing protein [Paraburkholderia sp. MPAMCS5]